MFCDIPILGRCLFCLPLRRGVLTYGYLNVVFSAFMVGVYSFAIHSQLGVTLVFHGVVANIDNKICLAMSIIEILFNLVLVYGAHMKILIYLQIYYYYAISTALLMFVLEIVSIATTDGLIFIAFELSALFFAGLCLHVYLIILTRSLIRKLEISEQHTYENQLHTIINGEIKAEGNGVYPPTVVPNETV